MPSQSTTSTVKTDSSAVFKTIVESIMMEAAEKCEEIDVECEEEYQVLRRKEISEQGELIEKADKKRRDNVLRDDRVSYTKLINNSRLDLLKAKTNIQNDIVTEVKRRISKDTSSRYQKLLEKLLTEAMFKLMEPEVYVTCRKQDQHMVSSTFQPAAHTYEKQTKLHMSVSFSQNTLPEKNCSGGMVVSNKKENISVDCLVDARVEQVCFLAMPMIVQMLFAGVQINRDSPKLSDLKAKTPDDPTCRLLEDQANSPSPQRTQLLEERLGIGTSSINLHGSQKETSNGPQSKEKHYDSKSVKVEETSQEKPPSKNQAHQQNNKDRRHSSVSPDPADADQRHSDSSTK